MAYPDRWNAIHRLVILAEKIEREYRKTDMFEFLFSKSDLQIAYNDMKELVKTIGIVTEERSEHCELSFKFKNHPTRSVVLVHVRKVSANGSIPAQILCDLTYTSEIRKINYMGFQATACKQMLNGMADPSFDWRTEARSFIT